MDAPNTLYYRCQNHTGMGNSINIQTGVSISNIGVLTLDAPANYQTTQSHTFTVKAVDTTGNNNETTATISVNVNDITPPVNPTAVFPPSGITNTNTVTVTLGSGAGGVVDAVRWQISINDGIWLDGSNDTFTHTLFDGSYSSGAIKVKALDAAGNSSIGIISNTEGFTIDTVPPAPPQVVFPTISPTNNPTVEVTLSEGSVSWEYSLDGGVTWIQPV